MPEAQFQNWQLEHDIFENNFTNKDQFTTFALENCVGFWSTSLDEDIFGVQHACMDWVVREEKGALKDL